MNQQTTRESAEDADRFRIIFDAAGDGILVADLETGTFADVNRAGCALFGYKRDELIGRPVGALSTGIAPYTQTEVMHRLERTRSGRPQIFEWHCKTKDGHLFWSEISLHRASFGGRRAAVAVVRDITERKRQQEELVQHAHLDMLTGLPNRWEFDRALQRDIARCERNSGPLCVAMADIDHFKIVNDTFGHQNGDAVLKQLAQLLRKGLRRSDFIARWGGEEFTILLPHTPLEAAEAVCNRLRETIAKHSPPEIGRPVTLSFGVTAYAAPDSPDEIVRRADRALYLSKQSGRNRVTAVQ